MTTTSTDIGDWLAAAVKAYPYLGRGISTLMPVVRPGFMTLAVTDGWHLLWSPEGLAMLERDGGAQAELIRHELEHLLRDHGGRRLGRDPIGWNYAGDMEINDDLNRTCLPHWAIYPEEAGHTAEEYYESMPHVCDGSCGGGSGAGAPLDGEPDGGIPKSAGERIAKAIAEDIVAAKARGEDVSNGLLVWATAKCAPRAAEIDRALMVRQLIGEAIRGRDDYSFSRVSRRQEGKVIIPGMIESRPKVSVVIDTSGSMGDMGDEVAGALAQVGRLSRAVIIDCDMTVHGKPRQLSSWKDVLKSRGGGGTDMRVGITAAHAMRPRPDLVMVLTDGYTPWPEPWPSRTVAVVFDKTVRLYRGVP
jgi:predicted metal-dependent peptidase